MTSIQLEKIRLQKQIWVPPKQSQISKTYKQLSAGKFLWVTANISDSAEKACPVWIYTNYIGSLVDSPICTALQGVFIGLCSTRNNLYYSLGNRSPCRLSMLSRKRICSENKFQWSGFRKYIFWRGSKFRQVEIIPSILINLIYLRNITYLAKPRFKVLKLLRIHFKEQNIEWIFEYLSSNEPW